jgi:hypothetical protein
MNLAKATALRDRLSISRFSTQEGIEAMDTPRWLKEFPCPSPNHRSDISPPMEIGSPLLAAVVKTEIATVDIKRQRELEERARVASMD